MWYHMATLIYLEISKSQLVLQNKTYERETNPHSIKFNIKFSQILPFMTNHFIYFVQFELIKVDSCSFSLKIM